MLLFAKDMGRGLVLRTASNVPFVALTVLILRLYNGILRQTALVVFLFSADAWCDLSRILEAGTKIVRNANGRGVTIDGERKDMGEAVQQMFAAIAQRYDRLNTVLSFGLHHRWRQRAVMASALLPGARLLDLCSGTADLALAFSQKLGSHGQVIATDFCEAMLLRGYKKAAKYQAPVTFALADAQHLPFQDETFDGVSVAFGLRNVDHLTTALQEMYRVLRPGGVAIVLEFGQPQGRLFGALYRCYSRYVLPRLGGWLSGHQEAYQYLPRTAAAFPAGGRFVQEMARQAFTDVQAYVLNGGIVYLYRATRPTVTVEIVPADR